MTVSGSWVSAWGAAVADVVRRHPQVGDGDRVVVGDHQDVHERVADVDLVSDLVDGDGATAGDLPRSDVGGQPAGSSAGDWAGAP